MAITKQMAQLILAEHAYKPITGHALLLGRQTIFMTPDEAQALVLEQGLPIRAEATIEYDTKTAVAHDKGYISDTSFFSLFSDAKISVCDVSDYEGADFIFDLSGELPADIMSQFDFIYNGSVLDNVFDPAGCMRNISRMLKPNGRVFHYEGLKHSGLVYLKFTPEWFFDYYAINNFKDCQAYVLTYNDYHSLYHILEWQAYSYRNSSLHPAEALRLSGDGLIIVIAEKCANSTIIRTPIESTYRRDSSEYIRASQSYALSPRRKFIATSALISGVRLQQAGKIKPEDQPYQKGSHGHKAVGFVS